MDKDILIKVENLSRYYGHFCAVDNISFELARGEVLGFLGPNGAGKSTTMQIISGNLAPSAGRVSINGFDILDAPRQAKASLGYLPEQPPLYKELSVDEYLLFCARLNRIPKSHIREAMARARARCGLEEVAHRLIMNLSKGYQQRVGIAQAIIHSPEVVILDEPTVGLDPNQIREIRQLIRELGNDHGVILSTHILPEVQATCDRVQIINKGRLALNDTLAGLNARMRANTLTVAFRQAPDIATLLGVAGVEAVDALQDNHFAVHINANSNPAEAISKLAVEHDWGLLELMPQRVSLEQIFMDITCKDDFQSDMDEAANA